jgi:hypothetical protein
MTTARARLNEAARVSAALLGTLPAALLASIVLCRSLPLREDRRFAVGFLLAIPLWVAGVCTVYLTRSGARAWLACLVAIGLLALAAWH